VTYGIDRRVVGYFLIGRAGGELAAAFI
jgi:hypothetical protein